MGKVKKIDENKKNKVKRKLFEKPVAIVKPYVAENLYKAPQIYVPQVVETRPLEETDEYLYENELEIYDDIPEIDNEQVGILDSIMNRFDQQEQVRILDGVMIRIDRHLNENRMNRNERYFAHNRECIGCCLCKGEESEHNHCCVPHCVLFSVQSKKESDHLTKSSMTPAEIACTMIKKITFHNFRRTFVNSSGDTYVIDLENKPEDQQLCYRSYVSWCKGNTPSTLSINNFADFYTYDDDSFIRNPKDYFSKTQNLTEPLAIDTTSDYNYVNDKPPATIQGNNSLQITVDFVTNFKGIITLYLQLAAQLVQTGTGEDENYTYFPFKFKSS
ncbi:uncharacterized protein LOC124815749 [Hydra vulgaris]|uniref:uncharacterized protein LOC124815749 n=1 Tax=Hydra vulgaris TaxID=6087 RepID=UPI001F5EA774|nr:uncharacterized protein LOC124815749 [Hydra vulgaris]